MGGGTVYIVDDDAAVRGSLTFFLMTAGFAARPYADPSTFLADAASLPPGCVLLDVRMPGISGFEVLERLAPRRAELPVVIMTGHGDVVTAVRAMKSGARDFLEKPFEEEMLLAILAQVFATLAGDVREQCRVADARSRLAALTDREREVLVRLLAGQPNKLVAFDLQISIRTVEMHRAAMMDRLQVRTFAEALRLALEGGFAPASRPVVPVAADLRR